MKKIARIIFSLFSILVVEASASTTKVMTLLIKADTIKTSDIKEFSRILNDISASEKKLTSQEEYYFQYLKASESFFIGKQDESISEFNALIKSNANENLKMRARLSIVNIYSAKENWIEGLKNLKSSLDSINSVTDSTLRANILSVASLFYNTMGQYNLGLKYAKSLQKIDLSLRNKCISLQLEIQSKLNIKTEEVDDNLFNNAILSCKDAKETIMVNFVIFFKAKSLIENHKPILAEKLLSEQYEDVINSQYYPLISAFNALLADINLKINKPDIAKSFAELTIGASAQKAENKYLILAYKVLYEYYLARGDHLAALKSYIKYAEADKANLDEVKAKTLAYQIAEHQSLEQNNKIALLDEQNKLLTVQQRLDQAEAFTNRLLIAALFCVILGLGTWGWHSWQNQRRLRQLAEYDSLTGLFSRGHFAQVAKSAVDYAKTLGTPVSCILLDVDKFKRINDTLGHATGDWALQAVALACRELCRQHEIIGRIGGEEFCFLLPECSEADAGLLAEKLRQALIRVDTSPSGHDFSLSASFGISSSASSGYRLDLLMQNADRAMYQAKHGGRNRVCVYCELQAENATL
jgi:diguanylate cyclase